MGDDAGGVQPVPRQHVAQQVLERGHLRLGEGALAVALELDADRAGVDVGDRAPGAGAGMPGAALLIDEHEEAAAAVDQVMGRDLGQRVAQPVERGLARQDGVVQNDEVGARAAAPVAVVGRRAPNRAGAHPPLRAARNGAGSQ